VSKLAKALIFKGFQPLATSSQQSYPQIFWMSSKALQNQGLRPVFKTSPNPQNSPNCQKQASFDPFILD
jgi:hypothetical protein